MSGYDLIYADPPWRYSFSRTANRRVENHYPTMSLPEIIALPVAEWAAPDAVLYLWGTAPKLREALAVVSGWGFEYRTNLVWVKPSIGMGYWARNRHEFLLVGTRGDYAPAELEEIIYAPRARHSAKPSEVYDLLEETYPEARKLELFARARRPGWDAWGNEV